MKTRFVLTTLIVFVLIIIGSVHSSQAVREVRDDQINSAEPQALNAASPFRGQPDYDSGWEIIAQDETKTLLHNLGGDTGKYVVDLQSYKQKSGSNKWYYGGDFVNDGSTNDEYGYYWYDLNGTSIKVKRNKSDYIAIKVRIRIWVVPSADYDSDWKTIGQGEINALTLIHNLGGQPHEYILDMQFNDSGGLGINHCKYGTDVYYRNGVEWTQEGAAWKNLTNSSITVIRGAHDVYAPKVRVRAWKVPTADYDSGWIQFNKDSRKSLDHKLGGPWNDLFVDVKFRNPGVLEVHNYYFGGDSIELGSNLYYGAWLDPLSGWTASILRGANDIFIDEVRVRVWANPLPKYDSGWRSISKDEFLTLSHNLGGNPDHYVVDLQFNDTGADGTTGRGVSHTHYGGDEFKHYPSGKKEYHGVNWWGLTGSQISVHRKADDLHADQIRVRIWIPPSPVRNSGWIGATPNGFGQDYNHSAYGSLDAYVIDLQFKDSAAAGLGVNQQGYGWNQYSEIIPGDEWTGATWSFLDKENISVTRGTKDFAAEEVKVRIWKNPFPDYDSKWTAMNPGTVEDFAHKLGGNPDDYVLDLQFLDENPGDLVNQVFYGGNTDYNPNGTRKKYGAFWYGLNRSNVKVHREIDDWTAEKVRVRIWITGDTPTNIFYLPLLIKQK